MHTWHGFVVTPGAMVASSLDYSFYNNKFKIGAWGGSSFNGEYIELSYFLTYNTGKSFKASLISHNNYSGWENPNIFSWNKYNSPNFLDIVVETSISEKFPLDMYFSTILFGQGGDFQTTPNGEVTNSYSNYLELRYPVVINDRLKITLFAGGAFSFFTEKTFYTRHDNLVNIGLKLQKNISILKYYRIIKAKAFWNPESKRAALEVNIALL
ncbi:hypothetical protein [Gramella sp. AN32]|uniref:Uncharacterized protein n=1 Tax=Christiangramia antarctica TaxID=2058158 RepID=A0ABW5XDA0_9FLAO|nr:hypothetical protein [Gramella sp. AN32]